MECRKLFFTRQAQARAASSTGGLGGAFGLGIDQIIKETYVNLCSNYWPGDKIHIIGYSRGAVAARALTGMISKCGVLRVEEMGCLWEVWRHFIDRKHNKSNNIVPHTISRNVWPETPEISFLGLFDTVLGRNYKESNLFAKIRFHDNKVNANVKSAVQILSLDDNRSIFQPLLWDGAHGDGAVEQIWIPGVHGDMGGLGNTFFGDVALLTMIDRILARNEIDIDIDYVDNLLLGLSNRHKVVSISNERRIAFLRALRNISRYPSRKGIGQKLHSVYDLVSNKKIYIRNRASTYWPKRKEFEDLNRAKTRYDPSIDNAFYKILNIMGPLDTIK